MKTALVCDWLTTMGGGEKVLSAILELYPSPIFTLICDRKNLIGTPFSEQEIHTSFIERLPFSKKWFRNYLPLFPLAVEQWNVKHFDIVISSSHCVAKGVITGVDQLHICYCHTPVRYGWDLYNTYLQEKNLQSGFRGAISKVILHYLRMWDSLSSNRVDVYVANSHYVAKRIFKIYGKKATVIYPPVDTDFFRLHPKKEDYYLTASRMVPYKRMDVIVEAFSQMPKKRLVVIGDGSERKKNQAKGGKNIEFLGRVSDDKLCHYLQRARAFLFAGVEDFGILPVEAMSSGTPVIAYNRGGVKETVVENKTGLFFEEQNVPSIVQAVLAFERKEEAFIPLKIRDHALSFSKKRFQEEFQAFVNKHYQEHLEKCM